MIPGCKSLSFTAFRLDFLHWLKSAILIFDAFKYFNIAAFFRLVTPCNRCKWYLQWFSSNTSITNSSTFFTLSVAYSQGFNLRDPKSTKDQFKIELNYCFQIKSAQFMHVSLRAQFIPDFSRGRRPRRHLIYLNTMY